MGIDSLKPAGTGLPISQPRATDKVETPATAATAAPAEAPVKGEGFDDPKKKLVSVTGGYKAYRPNLPVREDLMELVAARRSGQTSAPLADSATSTIADRGAEPPPRTADADFVAQAKAAGAKTPAQIEAKACALAKAAIEKDFGMQVKNGTAKWTAEDLTRAYESFKQMPAGDQAKLKGLDLIRDHAAPPEVQAEAGPNGVVAGLYSPNVDTKDGQRVKPGSITAYDAAYDNTDRKGSISVLTHEAGHAVANRDRDDAMAKANAATDVLNPKADLTQSTSDANNAQWGPRKHAPADTTNGAGELFDRKAAHDKPSRAFESAQNAVLKAIDHLQHAKTPEALTKAQAELAAAKAKRDTAQAALSGGKSESVAQNWVDATDKQEQTATDYAKAMIDYGPAKKASKAANAELAKLTHKPKKGDPESSEVAAFEKARGKEKPPSDYGKKTHDEGYAEAYALYQRDPAYMKKHFPNQYHYFHKHHESPND